MDEQNPRVGTDQTGEHRARQLRNEIDQTRDELSETVDAIQDRLRPSSIASSAAETVKQAAMSRARDVAESDSVTYMTANPIPMTIVGIGVVGLAWLAMAGREPQQWRGYRRREFYTPGANVRPRFAEDRTRGYGYQNETAWSESDLSDAASASGTRPMRLSERGEYDRYGSARYSTGMASQRYLQRAWRQNPLMIGAASAVVGALVGLGLPETERENELMGETRDRMIETVQDTVREKVEDVQQAATAAMSNVQDAARNAVGLSPEGEDQQRAREPQGSRA